MCVVAILRLQIKLAQFWAIVDTMLADDSGLVDKRFHLTF